jgi:uncharacterized protein (TIGR03437 family)
MRKLLILNGLAACMAAGCFAQQSVPLNTLPTRIVGHAQSETTSVISGAPNLVEGRELYNPEGLAVDTSVTPPILYVSDTGNNRVLAWKNAASFKNGQKADLVIGQQDMFHTSPQGGSSGAFKTGLSAPNGVIVDANGNLYVADSNNNRILRYPKPFAQFAQSGTVTPDLWVGQPSVGSSTANFNGAVDRQGLNLASSPFPINIALDGANPPNLWVVDGANHRVLRFPGKDIAAGGGGQSADLVLGQIDFSSTNQPAPTSTNRTIANAFAYPSGIAFDSKGNLYVTDSSADYSVGRVLVFSPPFSIAQNAARIMGVPPASTSTSQPSQDTLDRTAMLGPSSVFFIPQSSSDSAGKMGVLDMYSSRILVFDTIDKWPDPGQSVSPLATAAFGQPDCHNRGPNASTSKYVFAPSESVMFRPFAAAYFNNELYVADTGNNRLVVLPVTGGTANCSQTPGTVLGSAARVLGQDTFRMGQPNLIEGREFYFVAATSNNTVAAGAGVAIDNNSATPHLYVADTYNSRILGFKDFRSLTAGAKADIVLGQPDFSSGLCNVTNNANAPTASTLCYPAGIVVDGNGDLYVADTGNSRVLRFPAPFAHQGTLEQADLVLGQHQFNFNITDPTSSTMSAPYGLAIAGNNGLLVTDPNHNRVLYFPFTANGTFVAGDDNGKAATKVFGQPDFSTVTSGTDLNQLNSPLGIATDNESRLYVADGGNSRVLIFDHIFSTLSPNTGARADLPLTGFTQPRAVFVNQLTSEIWVGENSSTVRKFADYASLILQTPPTASASVVSLGAPLALTQDQYGDLIIADSTNRVGFYFPSVQAVNGGSFLSSRLGWAAPGMLTSLCSPSSACDPAKRQSLFGAVTTVNGDLPNPFPMPTTLGDVQVLFNGNPVPLYLASPSQINFVAPMNAPSSGNADLQVVQASTGRVYAAGSVAMAPYVPAILMLEYTGNMRQAAVLNQDGSVNSATNPAPRGTTISIYATGQGFVPNAPPDGTLGSGPVSAPIPLRVNIGGNYLDGMVYDSTSDIPKAQWLSYSGLNAYPGLWQINAYIPHAVVPGSKIPLILVGGGTASTDGSFNVYINVK